MTLILLVLYKDVRAAIPTLALFKILLSPSFHTFNEFLKFYLLKYIVYIVHLYETMTL